MRNVWTWCLAASLGLVLIAGRGSASEGFDDIAKLAKSGVTEDVLVAFVQASPVAYELSVEEILFLNDLGVTSKSIQEILNHGKDLRAGKEPVVTALPDDNAATAQNDDQLAAPVNLETLGTNQPAAENSETYVSPLTGAVSYTPEAIHEKEIVRETVYVPTPVMACTDCTISHFYEALTPYGTWVNIDDTWCWQPSVGCADANWRPYGNRGHWVWTDSGWCWESDYSWGWAPFHYGRWWRAPGYGWMWRPDTVWGPAWVNWRQNDTHWGWAPLPPAARFETRADVGVGFHFGGKHFGLDVGIGLDFGLRDRDYCFVPQDRFCERNLYTHFVPYDQQRALYSQTTIIQNNITINKTTNNIFVNGPSSKLVEQRTNRQLRQVRISDSDVQAGTVLGKTTVEDKENGTLRIYRPHVSAVAAETPAEVASRQVARSAANARPVADARVLAASARADELRERHFATQDAKRQESLTRQSAQIEEVAARRSDNEQKRLNTLMATENNAERKAEFAAKIAAERQKAEEARLQKIELEKQAAEQRKLTKQLAVEQNQVAQAKANTESARAAADTKVRLAAERAAREKANKDAAAQSEKILADQRAQAAALRASGKNDAEAKALAAETERKARLDADRAAREANRKAQLELAAKQKAQLDADKATHLKASTEKPVNVPPTRVGTETVPVDRTPREPNIGKVPNTKLPVEEKAVERATERTADKAAHDAALEAQRQKNAAERAAAEKLAADKAAERAAERAANKAERAQPKTLVPQKDFPVNPKTGQPYDPSNPNDPNNPRRRN